MDNLKSESLIDFRDKINLVQSISPTLELEDKVNAYLDELINQFDNITEKDIKESKRLNIPIVILSPKVLEKKNVDGSEYSPQLDVYIDNIDIIIEMAKNKSR